MKTRKIIAMLCVLAMFFSQATLPSMASPEPAPTDYLIINDQFGDEDLCGWTQRALDIQQNRCLLATEEVGDGNYALTYQSFSDAIEGSSDWVYEVIQRPVMGDGLTFVDGVDTVINTRVKQAGTGRAFLKMNAVPSSNYDEWNMNWGTLIYNDMGNCSVPNGWWESGYMSENFLTQNTGVIDEWLNVKVTIHGTSKTASYVITSDDGTKVDTFTNYSIDFPDAANLEESMLKTLAFRLRNPEKLYVDYIQVWQEGVAITDASASFKSLDDVEVAFDSNVPTINDLSNYVNLYESDGITLIETDKSFDALTNTVHLKPEVAVEMNQTYKVKINVEALEENMRYSYETENEFTIQTAACMAENLTIVGELIPDTKLIASYNPQPEGVVDNGSVVTWYKVVNDELTEIGTGKEFDVTTDHVDLTITYSVLPKMLVDGEEETGFITYCPVSVKPLTKPVVSGLTYDKDQAMIGTTLTAVYDYDDADGDNEFGSTIIWYSSPAADSDDYTEVGSGKSLLITEDLEGLYIRYTVIPRNQATFRNEGDLTECQTAIGPVGDLLTVSNLVVNGDFEQGNTDPWVTADFDSSNPIQVYSEDKYEGNYCMKISATPNANSRWYQEVSNLKMGTTYLVSFMAKPTDAANLNYEGYLWDFGSTGEPRPYRDQEVTKLTSDAWTRVTLTYVNSLASNKPSGSSYATSVNNGVLIDNYYFGELMVKDIVTNNIGSIKIPLTGEESVNITNGRILNQFDTTNGLISDTVELSIAEGEGVYTKGNDLIITNKAVAGDVLVKVACNPKMPGVAPFEKLVKVSLLPNSNTTPAVSNVKISGTVKTGNVLSLSYNFYQVEGNDDVSEYQWVYADEENGSYNNIENATASTYTVGSAYVDKFIKCIVTPKDAEGRKGTAKISNVLAKPTKPLAKELTIDGQWYIGGTVTGAYTYYDINGDTEAGTTYRWFISNTKDGDYTPIPNAATKDLVLTEEMQDKYIRFAVKPANNAEKGTGDDIVEALSEPYIGPTAPEARDITVSKSGSKYTAGYTYYHPHNLTESGTTYGWYIDNSLVSSDVEYIADFDDTQTITFKVTPSCVGAPTTGETASYTITIKGSGSSSMGGNFFAGGGGSRGNSSSIKPSVQPEQKHYDTENHWGREYILDMAKRGVFSADIDGNYQPDSIISRSEMITYLFKALKLTASEYAGGFSDVSSNDTFAGYLQTMIENGTIAKYDVFRPNASITREEMCKVLCISLENAGKFEKVEENKAAAFSDYGTISDWAKDYVNTIYSYGIMNGVSETEFAAQQPVTKAQVAAMLVRTLAYIEGGR